MSGKTTLEGPCMLRREEHVEIPMPGCVCRMCVPARAAAVKRDKYANPDKQRRKITKEKRRRVYARDGHKCVLCGSTERLTLDHVVPLIRGGTNLDSNLRTLCEPCNHIKGSHRSDEETRYLTETVECPYCPPRSCRVRRNRMARHLRRAHGKGAA